jgi:acyl-coenzyme A thioesterase PaaI-like protein
MGQGRRKVVAAQNISRMCLVCGVDNVAGLHACFYELAPEEGRTGLGDADGRSTCPELLGVFVPQPEHQSYPGRLHGGVAAAILDETIGRAITMLHPGIWGVTAELKVRFRRPVPLDEPIRAVGRITRDTRRLFEGAGEILLADGVVAVEATGRYLKMDLDEIAPAGMSDAEWFADPRRPPDLVDIAPTEET